MTREIRFTMILLRKIIGRLFVELNRVIFKRVFTMTFEGWQ